MSGYCGYSMSNNAIIAYENEEKPISKWTKQEILTIIKENYEVNDDVFNLLKKLKLSTLKSIALSYSSYHHTSSRFNKTDFYKVSFDEKGYRVEVLKNLIELDKKESKEKVKPAPKMVKIEFLTWFGTRVHPKATKHQEIVEYDSSKNYVITSVGKKFINANGFKFLEKEDI